MEIKFHPDFWKSFDKCFSMKPWYAIPRWFSDMKFRIICAYERVRYGYDRTWTWGLDWQLAEKLPKILRDMQKSLHGYPGDCKNTKEWKKIVEKIALGFESAYKLLELEYMIDDSKNKGHYKEDKKMRKKLEKQFDEGMKLFHKYFFDLWD